MRSIIRPANAKVLALSSGLLSAYPPKDIIAIIVARIADGGAPIKYNRGKNRRLYEKHSGTA